MDDWLLDDELFGEDEMFWEDDGDWLYEITYDLSERFFLSHNAYLPKELDRYSLGHLSAEDWWPLAQELNEIVDFELLLGLAATLDELLALPGLPTELLENPLLFLQTLLDGSLPPEPSGRRVGSRKLVRLARLVLDIAGAFSEVARATVRGWALAHRANMGISDFVDFDEEDLIDLLLADELPPAMTGFSMMIALTLMRWPQRAEGVPLPPEFEDPEMHESVMAQWEELPTGPTGMEEGTDQAEAFFAQGQLAHMLAQMGAVELLSPAEGDEESEISLAYSRLSRAILWVHDQCRPCPERDGVACKVATSGTERPLPLIDVAGEMANTGRIAGCVKM